MSLAALNQWDGATDPIGISSLVEDPEFRALPPAKKISALNQSQRQWADVLHAEDPKGYGGVIRDVERDFDSARRGVFEDGIAEDLRTGALTEAEAASLIKRGYSALNGKAQYAAERYGPESEIAGPWTTHKLPLTGADGKSQGFMYLRRPNAPRQDGSDRVEVSWTVNSKDGGQITGTDDVDAATLLPSLTAKAIAKQVLGGGEKDAEDVQALTKLKETDPDAFAAQAAAMIFSQKAQENPELADAIGQGFWKGLPGQAAKGFLKLGLAARYGVPALFGSKEAAKKYQEGEQEVEGDIEGQSRLGFRGRFRDKLFTGLSEEIIPLALSAGTSLAASATRKTATALTEKAAEKFLKAAGVETLESASPTLRALSGGFGRLMGTKAYEGKFVNTLADRVTNALAFLPSSMRAGLDNMAQTYDKADEYRAQAAAAEQAGNATAAKLATQKAEDLEDNATLNMWAGTSVELLSENIWLNEMMITRGGRKFGDIATGVLARKLGDATRLQQITGRIKDIAGAAIKAGGQEGAEEVVAGIGGRAWMNQFAEQNQDLLADLPLEFATGAVLGGLMGAAKALKADGRPELEAELKTRGLDGDTAAAESWQRIQAKVAAPDAIQSAIEADAAEPFDTGATDESGTPAVPPAFQPPAPLPVAPEPADVAESLKPADDLTEIKADTAKAAEAIAATGLAPQTAEALAEIAGEAQISEIGGNAPAEITPASIAQQAVSPTIESGGAGSSPVAGGATIYAGQPESLPGGVNPPPGLPSQLPLEQSGLGAGAATTAETQPLKVTTPAVEPAAASEPVAAADEVGPEIPSAAAISAGGMEGVEDLERGAPPLDPSNSYFENNLEQRAWRIAAGFQYDPTNSDWVHPAFPGVPRAIAESDITDSNPPKKADVQRVYDALKERYEKRPEAAAPKEEDWLKVGRFVKVPQTFPVYKNGEVAGSKTSMVGAKITRMMPDGRVETRLTQGGYAVVDPSEIVDAPTHIGNAPTDPQPTTQPANEKEEARQGQLQVSEAAATTNPAAESSPSTEAETAPAPIPATKAALHQASLTEGWLKILKDCLSK